MSKDSNSLEFSEIYTFSEFSNLADYSFMDSLQEDPQATTDGNDHLPREVKSGHYVPVNPTAIPEFEYITHSKTLFKELGLSDDLALDKNFQRLFSGDISVARGSMRKTGWATGYALSIFGTEYTQQCPFGNGNGYGDGRAISVFEGLFNGNRVEMQLKGGGTTPYCRGGDGRAVLRSSIREFLAQEYMHSLGIPTSRSLTLFVSRLETVKRPWYSQNSTTIDPDVLIDNRTAITTRVASSFIRVGQLELFARRLRSNTHQGALKELEMIVKHLISREYKHVINTNQDLAVQIVELAILFRERLILLVANWIRVGYCQGNFNSDNCAAGGFTLDYGPFGFCELFNPEFQPWTGGGNHFSFFNQPVAAEANYHMFYTAIRPLLVNNKKELAKLDSIRESFADAMNNEINTMWANKLGLINYDQDIVSELLQLMASSKVDYTIFFRKLSNIPDQLQSLKESFYHPISKQNEHQWNNWLQRWRHYILNGSDKQLKSDQMKLVNPKYTWREWLIAPAYQEAEQGNYSLIKELQEVFSRPYDDQSPENESKYDRLRPEKYFNSGGISHYSCSS